MKTVAEVIGVSRSNLIERTRERAKKRVGRPPRPDEKLVSEIKAVIVMLAAPSGAMTDASPSMSATAAVLRRL